MRVSTSFPHETFHEDTRIPLSDGTRLYARVWRPVESGPGSAAGPVPALLEYVPYRLTDATAPRDGQRHPWYAGHGYASVRVDVRGHGNSEGTPGDVFSDVELADGVEVIDWLASRPWCSGRVGMFGISWGGGNSLRLAALAPEPLKAVVTVCGTDDRYDNAGHYRGGSVLAEEMHAGAAAMLAFASRPPDPQYVGDVWRDMWVKRLEEMQPLGHAWLGHQTRDGYWRHDSVRADYGAVRAAVLAVGGWHDPHRDTVLRLVENLPSERVRGVIGPWSQQYPDRELPPGPAIGFLQETLRWWDHWLKDVDTGVMGEPLLRSYLADPHPPITPPPPEPPRVPATSRGAATPRVPVASQGPSTPWSPPTPPGSATSQDPTTLQGSATPQGPATPGGPASATASVPPGANPPIRPTRPATARPALPGRWVGDESWPSPAVSTRSHVLPGTPVVVHSPQHTGSDAGRFVPLGSDGGFPPDQREDDGKSVCFDFDVPEELWILGRPRVRLRLTSPVERGQVAARLCDVAPDGSSTLITWGVLNLSARQGTDRVVPWPPAGTEEVSFELDPIGHVLRAGRRLRLAVSSAYWPWIWPQTSSRFTLDPAGSVLELPVRDPDSGAAVTFDEPEQAEPLGVITPTTLDEPRPERLVVRDVAAGVRRLEVDPSPDAVRVHPDGLEYSEEARVTYTIQDSDPLSARAHSDWTIRLHRPELAWNTTVETHSHLACTATDFIASDEVICRDGDEVVFHRTWEKRLPRTAG
ncbi:CocE/NonD family hydrolase [Streptomyces cavernae]|uniref:CocE/NonD family hydrolase n=1 Tax=Streptomyces cavernae TaxID=2259034 RepID=UPI000FEBABFA|nr:CocE/NonD family hydrolase [Streptomyces cavernae]